MHNVTKTVVINDLTNFPINYTLGATQAASTAAAGDNLFIGGLLGYTSTGVPLSKITRVAASRARLGTNHIVNVSSGTATEITVTGTIPANYKFYLSFDIVNVNWNNQYAAKRLKNFKARPFEIAITTGDTAATTLAKIWNTINSIYRQRNVKIPDFQLVLPTTATVSGVYNDGTTFNAVLVSALTQGILKLTSLNDLNFATNSEYEYFENFKVVGADNAPSPYVTVFNPSVVQAQNVGIGTFNEMIAKRTMLSQDWNTLFFSQGKGVQAQMPIAGNLYTEFSVTFSASRGDFHDYFPGTNSETEEVIIWVNQTALEAQCDLLADYLDRSTGTKIYNAYVATVYTNGATQAQFKTNV